MLEDLFHKWLREGGLLSEESVRGKRNSDVVCNSLGRGGSTAVDEVVVPLENNLRTLKDNIQD